MKTAIFNLIILDESGSMCQVTRRTIDGCNETINTIRTAQKQFAETQQHFVSIYVFQGEGQRPSRYLIKNMPIEEVRHITEKDYEPWGNTPLYDAIGSTLADLKSVAKTHELAIGSVTIITDGMENSSREYSHGHVARMISALKEEGWHFNFIGANIDVERTARSFNIESYLEFKQDDAGMKEMFERERNARMSHMQAVDLEISHCIMADQDESMDEEERKKLFKSHMKKASRNFFDK